MFHRKVRPMKQKRFAGIALQSCMEQMKYETKYYSIHIGGGVKENSINRVKYEVLLYKRLTNFMTKCTMKPSKTDQNHKKSRKIVTENRKTWKNEGAE